jgi:hypothetical protein
MVSQREVEQQWVFQARELVGDPSGAALCRFDTMTAQE